jgi:hypothetical protein
MNIAAIIPCRGRTQQTVANARRLLATAGDVAWRLYAVGGREDRETLQALARLDIPTLTPDADRLTYWQALAEATAITSEPLIATLANDLLPGMHWLQRAAESYAQAFGQGDGMIGFNGDSHEVDHSCHFLISRSLLERLGGWPVWYQHNFGDTELCQRATAMGVYAKAPWALLYHDHPYWGGHDDPVYAEGRATIDRDAALFDQRRRQGWPSVRTTAVTGPPRAVISAVAYAG